MKGDMLGVTLVVILIAGCIQSGELSKSVQCREVQVPYESQEEYIKTEYYTETVPYTAQECEDKKLVYSITNVVYEGSVCNTREEVCNKYVLGLCTRKTLYCVDRTISCALILNNLDDARGPWSIDWEFYKEGSNTVEATDHITEWLYPHTSATFSGTGRITAKELLTTSYTCKYYVTNEPTKQVCRDVIKYKEVQKERQVTAYRPVTKYRTEQKCD